MVNLRRSRLALLLLTLCCGLYSASALPAPHPSMPTATAALTSTSTATTFSTAAAEATMTGSPTHQLYKRTCNKKRDDTSPDLAGYWWDCTTTTSSKPTSTSSSAKKASDPYGKGIQAHMAVMGSICMALGLYFMLLGFSLFRTTIGAAGFVGGNILTWVLLNTAEPPGGYAHQAVLYIGVCFAVGLVIAGVAIFCWKKGTFFLGALGGFFLSIYIWSWRADLVLVNTYARYFTSLGFAVVGMLGILCFERATVILSTAIIGAYLFILGLDLLIHTYFVNGPRTLLNANHRIYVPYTLDNKIYAMLAAILALILISVIWQKVYTRGHRFGLELIK